MIIASKAFQNYQVIDYLTKRTWGGAKCWPFVELFENFYMWLYPHPSGLLCGGLLELLSGMPRLFFPHRFGAINISRFDLTAKNACPALETPQNGGLVCVAEKRVSTERCSVKCNHGYQHIIRPNQFEECGPSTNFRWSTEANMTPILGCMGEFPRMVPSRKWSYVKVMLSQVSVC